MKFWLVVDSLKQLTLILCMVVASAKTCSHAITMYQQEYSVYEVLPANEDPNGVNNIAAAPANQAPQ
jgi:hypothetical protein